MNYLSVLGGICTCALGWNSRQRLFNLWNHKLLVMGSLPLTHWMKTLVSGSLIPVPIAGIPILPTGARLVFCGAGNSGWEIVGNYRQGNNKTNFKTSEKKLKRVDHLWIRLLLVQKFKTQKHQQWTIQHVKKNSEKSTYQRTPIHT